MIQCAKGLWKVPIIATTNPTLSSAFFTSFNHTYQTLLRDAEAGIFFPTMQLPEIRSWYWSSSKNLPGSGILSWWVACLLHFMKLEKIFYFQNYVKSTFRKLSPRVFWMDFLILKLFFNLFPNKSFACKKKMG